MLMTTMVVQVGVKFAENCSEEDAKYHDDSDDN